MVGFFFRKYATFAKISWVDEMYVKDESMFKTLKFKRKKKVVIFN